MILSGRKHLARFLKACHGLSMVIVHCSEKGGSGKTTLCVEHAVWAFDRGVKVAVIDADRQVQSGHWLRQVEPAIPVAIVDATSAARQALRDFGDRFDLVLIDAPGKFESESIVLLDEADIALVPVMASPLDVRSAVTWSKNVLAAVLRRHPGKPVVRFVINGLDMRTNVAKEISEFANRMDPPATKARIRRLAEFVNAANRTSVMRMGYAARRGRADCVRLFREVAQLGERVEQDSHSTRRAANE
jgi:chromosome partitioning protein